MTFSKRTIAITAIGLLLLSFGFSGRLMARPLAEDPIPITRIGEFGTSGVFDATANYAYFAEGNRLNVVSFTDPYHPVIVGEAFSAVPFGNIRVSPDGTRLIARNMGSPTLLTLYDVSTPTAPRELTQVAVPNEVSDIRTMLIAGNRLYITSSGGVLIYSWANNTLTLRGIVGGAYNTPNIFIEDDTLVATYYGATNNPVSVQLFDISDEAHPFLAGSVPTIGGVAIPANGYLYVTNYPQGDIYTEIWDIRDPSTPSRLATYPELDWYPQGRQGNVILTSYGSTWRFWDVSNPTVPVQVGEISENGPLTLAKWVNPTTIYLDGVTRALLPNFNTIERQGTYPGRGYGAIVPIGNQYLYALNYEGGVDIYDGADPTAPRLKATVLNDVLPEIGSYWVEGQRLYSAQATDIAVVDVSNPLAPQLVGRPPSGGRIEFAGVSNGYLYGRYADEPKFYILRLSDLSATSVEFDPGYACRELAVAENILAQRCGIFNSGSSLIRLYDLSVPTAPTLRGTIEAGYYQGTLTLQPPYLFMTYNDVELYNISSLDAPEFIGIVPNTGQLNCFTLLPLRDDQYLRQCGGGQDDVLDLSNPYFPSTTRTFSVPDGYPSVRDDIMYFTSRSGLETWRIHYPFTYQPVDYPYKTYLPVVSKQ